jgi:hypothetical protein
MAMPDAPMPAGAGVPTAVNNPVVESIEYVSTAPAPPAAPGFVT